VPTHDHPVARGYLVGLLHFSDKHRVNK